MDTDVQPFDLLLDLESRCRAVAALLPELDKQVEAEWVGIGFRIGGDKLMAAMSEIEEILDLPEFTVVPGVRSWVIGVANVRGNLLPIVDLKGYVTGENVKGRNKGRIIVIGYKGFNTGLIVEEVYGMRHFLLKDRTTEIPAIDKSVSTYINNAFIQNEEYWPVFSFVNLVREERFLQASL
jgi:twitching motility protein PilI